MAMPRPTRSVQRSGSVLPPARPFLATARPQAGAGKTGVLPSSDSCFGVYEGCKDNNPLTPCLAFNVVLGYYCSSCCLGGGGG